MHAHALTYLQAHAGARKYSADDRDTLARAKSFRFHKVFDGECNGPELCMYNGAGRNGGPEMKEKKYALSNDQRGLSLGWSNDNQGTEEQRAVRCSQACLTKRKPLHGGS